MKTILWGNYKGGVGKTTSVFQVATYFAEAGKKVLLVDLDPQCSLSNTERILSNLYSTKQGRPTFTTSHYNRVRLLPPYLKSHSSNTSTHLAFNITIMYHLMLPLSTGIF